LRPLIVSISKATNSFEIDPSKMSDGKENQIEENRKNLFEGAELVFKGIRHSVSCLPLEFRAVCHQLQVEVREKFPELKHAVVGGFFFLRFMCPAIVSPEGFGVICDGPPMPSEARRALVLVSKLLQNLANGKSFGSKEEYMIPMQKFINNNQDEIKAFFDELASVNPAEIEFRPFMTNVAEEEFTEYLRYIHSQLVLSRTKVEEALIQKAQSDGVPSPESYPPLLNFKRIMDSLPPPPNEKEQKALIETRRRNRLKNNPQDPIGIFVGTSSETRDNPTSSGPQKDSGHKGTSSSSSSSSRRNTLTKEGKHKEGKPHPLCTLL